MCLYTTLLGSTASSVSPSAIPASQPSLVPSASLSQQPTEHWYYSELIVMDKHLPTSIHLCSAQCVCVRPCVAHQGDSDAKSGWAALYVPGNCSNSHNLQLEPHTNSSCRCSAADHCIHSVHIEGASLSAFHTPTMSQ
jgi:hypothetical protein